MTDIQAFLTDLLIEAGFDPEDHEDLARELEPVLLKRIISKLAVKLSPAQREEAEQFLASANSERFWDLCKINIPNYEEYFVQILDEFEKEYLAEFEE